MKKLVIIIMAILLVFTFVACSTSQPKDIELTDTLEDIFAKIHEAMPADIVEMLALTEVTADNVSYYLGTDKVVYTEALAGEAMMGFMPHSIVLLRVDEDTDVEATVKLIQENADGYKWVCAGVTEDKVLVRSIGHTIALVIDENAEEIMKVFEDMESES